MYPLIKNIFKNTTPLSLIKQNSHTLIDKYKSNITIKIFLGQPFKEILSSTTLENLKQKLGNSGIDYYFPHPREKKYLFNWKIAASNLIFEEYITNTLTQEINSNIEVHTVLSSTALNIISLNGVRIYCYYDELINQYEEIYSMFSNMGAILMKI